MSDPIDRQAAIDALEGEIEVVGKSNAEAVLKYTKMVCDRLKALPSAQPEHRWIPVTEQLPEDGQNVLVTVEGWYEGNMFERDADLATYFSFGGYIDGFDTVNDWIEYGEWKATAWMPLPEPFRKETDGRTKTDGNNHAN